MTIKAGDIIKDTTTDKHYYVFTCDDGLGINAVNETYINRDLKFYGQEMYLLEPNDSDYEVIEHFGDGSLSNGWKWYDGAKCEYAVTSDV